MLQWYEGANREEAEDGEREVEGEEGDEGEGEGTEDEDVVFSMGGFDLSKKRKQPTRKWTDEVRFAAGVVRRKAIPCGTSVAF